MIDSGLCLSLIRQMYSPVSLATNGLKCKLKFSDKKDTWKWILIFYFSITQNTKEKIKLKNKNYAENAYCNCFVCMMLT